MRRIGIDQQFFTIYQDVGIDFREISPVPILCEALFDPDASSALSGSLQLAKWIFREDSFDATTRYRRGRFYERANPSQPSSFGVLPRTSEDFQYSTRPRLMFVFDQYQLVPSVYPKSVALGANDSIWRIVSRPERISTGEFLFVLKARYRFGILPEIEPSSVPEIGRKKVMETLDGLADAAYRESAGSVIDRARDVAQSSLATWAAFKFGDTKLLHTDLGNIIQKLKAKEDRVALRAGEIVQRLHSRVKPNEQVRYGFRPPLEDDSELALNCIGFIIRELGWASE